MNSIHEIREYVRGLSVQRKLNFYDRFGSHLTIGIRSVLHSSSMSDRDKLESIRALNELMHQIFNWTWRLRAEDNSFDDIACFGDVTLYASQNPAAAAEIGAALQATVRLR